jgi:hypothetical protein
MVLVGSDLQSALLSKTGSAAERRLRRAEYQEMLEPPQV